MYRITLWSGGKPVMQNYTPETPKMSEGCVAFRSEGGSLVRLVGNISIEEGDFKERPISSKQR